MAHSRPPNCRNLVALGISAREYVLCQFSSPEKWVERSAQQRHEGNGAAGGEATTLQLMCVHQTGIRAKTLVAKEENPFEPIYVTIAMGTNATTCPSKNNGYNLTSF